MTDGNMLQIIFFALIAGLAVTYLRDDRKTVLLNFFEGVTDITIKMVHFVMKLAPYGVFALVASVTGQYGSNIIVTLLGYFLTTLLALAVHVFLFNSLVIILLTDLRSEKFLAGHKSGAAGCFLHKFQFSDPAGEYRMCRGKSGQQTGNCQFRSAPRCNDQYGWHRHFSGCFSGLYRYRLRDGIDPFGPVD